jgi:succinate dehydrogenase / fumarate reductase membrane anchor subunit
VSRPAHGLYSWIIQRMTAVYLAVYLLYILQQWMFRLASPFNGIGLGVFIVTLLLHAWIGTRDILMDYVHGLALRLSLFVLVIFILLLSGIWALRSLVIVL